jgi:transcriptional regulator with XRE-family HTH domain
MAKKRPRETPGLIAQLKEKIQQSGRSLNQLGIASGVDVSMLSRFMRGERNLSLQAAEKVCDALGLALAEARRRPRPRKADEGKHP